MADRLDENSRASKPVLVVGAGFSGLMSAYYLVRAGFRVKIVESGARAGGLIGTLKTQHGLVETAANGLLANRDIEEIFKELKLVPLQTRAEAKRRFIFRDKGFRRWPLGLSASLRMIAFVLRFIFFRQSVKPRDDETIGQWGDRVLGAEGSRYFLQAAMQGIYAGDPDRMSASLILGRFFRPNRAGSRFRGTVAPAHGMGSLIQALESDLRSKGVEFDFGVSYTLEREPQRPVVLAVSQNAAARILGGECAEMLPVVSVTLFFEKTDPKTIGFGCLFPPVEKRAALGVLKNDFIFQNRTVGGLHSETWILGGANGAGLVSRPDEDIVGLILRERKDLFGLDEHPKSQVVTKWPQALPHYTPALQKAVDGLKRAPNVFLIGNYLGSIGLSQIAAQAKTLPEKLSRDGRWPQ